jgi:hypothetical protein
LKRRASQPRRRVLVTLLFLAQHYRQNFVAHQSQRRQQHQRRRLPLQKLQ